MSQVAPDDPFYGSHNMSCLEFVRASPGGFIVYTVYIFVFTPCCQVDYI